MEKKNSDLKAEIKAELSEERSDPMWFYDEPDEMWQNFRRESRQVETEYLELRVVLRDAEAALRSSPRDECLQARVKYVSQRLADLEKQAPWISAELPIEVLLWGVPHG